MIHGQDKPHCSFKANNKGFLIHGLWPTFRNGSWPQFCPGPPLRLDNIKDLETELQKYWPESLEGMNRDALWKHEWSRHGTCAMSILPSMQKFFASTLSLYKSMDFIEGFRKSQISPLGGGIYERGDILKALKISPPVQASPVIVCDGNKLYEVRYCIDKALRFVSCDAVQNSDLFLATCPRKVLLPHELSYSLSQF